jgi:uncharacterized glyoxalase superfamily protein PhnB
VAATPVAYPTIMPAMRYRALPAALNWLCDAFGFVKHAVITSDNGSVVWAQIAHGPSLVLLSSANDARGNQNMRQPDEIGGAETQTCYIVVPDVDAHCAKAVARGAELIFGVQDFEFGGRVYACRDPEGHIWNFGTYSPPPLPAPLQAASAAPPPSPTWTAACVGAIAGAAIAGGAFMLLRPHVIRVVSAPSMSMPLAKFEPLPVAPETKRLTALSNSAAASAESVNSQMYAVRLVRIRRALKEAERMQNAVTLQLEQERSARILAEGKVQDAQQKLTSEKTAKEQALRVAEDIREQLKQAQTIALPVPKPATPVKVPQKVTKKDGPKSVQRGPDTMPELIP